MKEKKAVNYGSIKNVNYYVHFRYNNKPQCCDENVREHVKHYLIHISKGKTGLCFIPVRENHLQTNMSNN